MAHKKKISNRSAGGGEFVSYDVKRLRHMSDEEIQAYYDQVEPIADGEVQEIFDRVMPQISYEIATIEQQKRTSHIGGKISKIVLVAVCLTLMLSVVAQALGVPVWEMILSWTQEHLIINITQDGTPETGNKAMRGKFSAIEIQTWGEDICNALESIDFYPPLPRLKPEGLVLEDFLFTNNELGRVYLSALFVDSNNNTLSLVVERPSSGNYDGSYEIYIERDLNASEQLVINGQKYYYVTNIGMNSFFWHIGGVAYSIFTSFEPTVIWNMLSSIQYD